MLDTLFCVAACALKHVRYLHPATPGLKITSIQVQSCVCIDHHTNSMTFYYSNLKALREPCRPHPPQLAGPEGVGAIARATPPLSAPLMAGENRSAALRLVL